MKRANFPGRREAKRKQAEESQATWRALTIDQQLLELKARPGDSKRQVERLTKLKTLGHRIAPIGVAPKPVPVDQQVAEAEGVEKQAKAPPKSDLKATKAFKKKQQKEE